MLQGDKGVKKEGVILSLLEIRVEVRALTFPLAIF